MHRCVVFRHPCPTTKLKLYIKNIWANQKLPIENLRKIEYLNWKYSGKSCKVKEILFLRETEDYTHYQRSRLWSTQKYPFILDLRFSVVLPRVGYGVRAVVLTSKGKKGWTSLLTPNPSYVHPLSHSTPYSTLKFVTLLTLVFQSPVDGFKVTGSSFTPIDLHPRLY